MQPRPGAGLTLSQPNSFETVADNCVEDALLELVEDLAPSSVAAIWSAVAATFAAVTAFVTMSVQRRNLLESARPELVLLEFARTKVDAGDAPADGLDIATIKNVGRGPALHVHMNAFNTVDNRPTYVMGTVRLPIVAVNESIRIDSRIFIYWKNVPESAGGTMPINVEILCSDGHNRRHRTHYSLLALSGGAAVYTGPEIIAPGVMLGMRTTQSRGQRSIKFSRAMKRVPLLGRLVRNPFV